jgi:hypothetical protein
LKGNPDERIQGRGMAAFHVLGKQSDEIRKGGRSREEAEEAVK